MVCWLFFFARTTTIITKQNKNRNLNKKNIYTNDYKNN